MEILSWLCKHGIHLKVVYHPIQNWGGLDVAEHWSCQCGKKTEGVWHGFD